MDLCPIVFLCEILESEVDKIIIGNAQQCEYRKTCYGIAMYDGKLLLSVNKNLNEYSLPGGGVEENETLKECLKREFAEEVGFNIIETAEFVNIDCFWTKRDGRLMETDANFLFARVDLDNNFEPSEVFHYYLWLDVNEVLQKIDFPYQRKALEKFLEEYDKIDFKFN